MVQNEIMELAEIIGTLPNYTDEYHENESKYLIISRTAQWLEQKNPKLDINGFCQLCWNSR